MPRRLPPFESQLLAQGRLTLPGPTAEQRHYAHRRPEGHDHYVWSGTEHRMRRVILAGPLSYREARAEVTSLVACGWPWAHGMAQYRRSNCTRCMQPYREWEHAPDCPTHVWRRVSDTTALSYTDVQQAWERLRNQDRDPTPLIELQAGLLAVLGQDLDRSILFGEGEDGTAEEGQESADRVRGRDFGDGDAAERVPPVVRQRQRPAAAQPELQAVAGTRVALADPDARLRALARAARRVGQRRSSEHPLSRRAHD